MTQSTSSGPPWPLRALRAGFATLWRLYQLVLGLLLIAALVFSVVLWKSFHVGDIRALRDKPPRTTAFIESARAENQEKAVRWTWIPLDSVPRELRRMVLVAEDAKFYSHAGFDWESIEYAIIANRQSGRNARGASTITQQTAKNLFLSGEKAMQRKLHEAAITVLLEYHLEKDRILEIYLNIAQFGPGVFGVREGARHHFGKEPGALTRDEMLSLAALLPAPNRWDPKTPSRAYVNHRNRVARNYGLYGGIRAAAAGARADTASGDSPEALDSLGVLLSQERWGDLRTVPVWELRGNGASDDAVPVDSVGAEDGGFTGVPAADAAGASDGTDAANSAENGADNESGRISGHQEE